MTLPALAGISGGRTSAMMGERLVLAGVDFEPCFQNTGEEDERTLDFLRRLEDDWNRPITRLEWRPPPRPGDPPRLATFAVLRHEELARRGEPLRAMLESLAAYRRTLGLAPVSPWAMSRVCTAYLKIRTQHRYAQSLGWEDYVCYVGLRADEPDRVAKQRSASGVLLRFPLHEDGVTVEDVRRHWAQKPFDLEVPEHLGNCRGCFMKDERDLATALLEPGSGAERYVAIERDFGPMRRGGRPSYAQVLAEAPARMRIRAALAVGGPVPEDTGLEPRRLRLVVAQERKPRSEPWSCSCAGAEAIAAEGDD